METETFSGGPDDMATREEALQPAAGRIALFDSNGQRKAQATVLTEIGQQHHLFHDPDSGAFARVQCLRVTSLLLSGMFLGSLFTLPHATSQGAMIVWWHAAMAFGSTAGELVALKTFRGSVA